MYQEIPPFIRTGKVEKYYGPEHRLGPHPAPVHYIGYGPVEPKWDCDLHELEAAYWHENRQFHFALPLGHSDWWGEPKISEDAPYNVTYVQGAIDGRGYPAWLFKSTNARGVWIRYRRFGQYVNAAREELEHACLVQPRPSLHHDGRRNLLLIFIDSVTGEVQYYDEGNEFAKKFHTGWYIPDGKIWHAGVTENHEIQIEYYRHKTKGPTVSTVVDETSDVPSMVVTDVSIIENALPETTEATDTTEPPLVGITDVKLE